MILCLPYPPSINSWKDPGSGHAYLTPEVKRYKAACAALLRRHLGREPVLLQGPVMLEINLYRPSRTGDISNRIKILEDSLAGICFENDSQVAALVVLRFEDKERPRAVVRVTPWETPGAYVSFLVRPEQERDAVEIGRILTETRKKATQARAKRSPSARARTTTPSPAVYRPGKPR